MTIYAIFARVQLHISSVSDPHHFDPDPDSAFHFDADPDPTFHSGADQDTTFHADDDPDPTFQFDADPDSTTHFFSRFRPSNAPIKNDP